MGETQSRTAPQTASRLRGNGRPFPDTEFRFPTVPIFQEFFPPFGFVSSSTSNRSGNGVFFTTMDSNSGNGNSNNGHRNTNNDSNNINSTSSFPKTQNPPSGTTDTNSTTSPSSGISAPYNNYTNSSVNSKDFEAASYHKTKGNEYFNARDYNAAIAEYTAAIAANDEEATYYTNRAFCNRRLKDWPKVVADARQALNLNDESVKAHYLLGLGLVQTGEADEGLKKLLKAKSLASAAKTNFVEDIVRQIKLAKQTIWEREHDEKLHLYAELMEFMTEKFVLLRNLDLITPEDYERRGAQLQAVFDTIIKLESPFEIPSHLKCNISTCLMKDPVCTKSGLTYERDLITEHIHKNGQFDPITRKRCVIEDLIPNYAIKEGTEYFIDKYPWAVADEPLDDI